MSSNRGQRQNRNSRQYNMHIYGDGPGSVQGDNAHVTNNFNNYYSTSPAIVPEQQTRKESQKASSQRLQIISFIFLVLSLTSCVLAAYIPQLPPSLVTVAFILLVVSGAIAGIANKMWKN